MAEEGLSVARSPDIVEPCGVKREGRLDVADGAAGAPRAGVERLVERLMMSLP
jgi:hypothetical protein